MKSRNFLIRICLLMIGILSFVGCATVEQTIYLGDVEVSAPIITPPSHININKQVGDVTISPRFSILTNTDKMSGSTAERYTGTFKIDDSTFYRAKKQNLEWEPYQLTAGLDLDLKISQSISIFGGMNLSNGNNKNSLGGNVGLGFHNHDKEYIIRMDLGLTIQEYDFTAVTIVQTKTTYIWGDEDEFWDIFADKGSTTNVNPFITLTINSSYQYGLLDWFITGGYFTQNLLGYKPGSYSIPLFFPLPIVGTYTKIDKRSDMTAGFLYLNPGLSFNLSNELNLSLSAKIMNEVSSTSSTHWYVMPALQINYQP